MLMNTIKAIAYFTKKVPKFALVSAVTLCNFQSCYATNCVSDLLPDYIESTTASDQISWNAVAYTDGDTNSIYLAGSATSSALFSQSAQGVFAGKHNISTGAIVWAKQLFWTNAHSATAVAVNADATIMAVTGI